MTIRTTTMDSPVGVLTLTADSGRLTGVAMDGQRHAAAPPERARRDDAWFTDVVAQLQEYFAGGRHAFDIPIQLEGTDFQRRVWTQLAEIPYGETVSYRDIASGVGDPKACRAVGLANGRNPVAIVVPCHRVIGADGRLTGYGGGLDRKRWLLEHEASHR